MGKWVDEVTLALCVWPVREAYPMVYMHHVIAASSKLNPIWALDIISEQYHRLTGPFNVGNSDATARQLHSHFSGSLCPVFILWCPDSHFMYVFIFYTHHISSFIQIGGRKKTT